MSFQEKNITVTLVSFSLILLFYSNRIFQLVQDGGLNSTDVFRLWAIVIVLGIIVTIIGAPCQLAHTMVQIAYLLSKMYKC